MLWGILLLVFYLVVVLVTAALVFYIYWRFIFLRDPDRKIPRGNVIVSPADGKVIEVKKIDKKSIKVKKGLMGKINTLVSDTVKEGYLVSIFMNPFNVHVNRVPLEGEVLEIKHTKGKFLPVMNLENAMENEKTEVLIKNKKIGKYKVIQIAGFLARRIYTFLQKKDEVKTGERFGFINLGSQVSVILPKKVKMLVKKGDKVRAGSTVIAKY